MATEGQLRGMLLEEVILALLQASGFRTVTTASDPTLTKGPSGMEVKGRASNHQIDAIASFRVEMPFSYPSRLLVEAKCYRQNSVGIEVVRNAIGVMKDINEFFDPTAQPPIQRWHYQYAIFSATTFSSGAEDFAYAHDVYPVPLRRVGALSPVVSQIQKIDRDLAGDINVQLKDLRGAARSSFSRAVVQPFDFVEHELDLPEAMHGILGAIVGDLEVLGGALLTRLASGLPIFLVPVDRQRLEQLAELEHEAEVAIRFTRKSGWWIEWEEEKVLTFDLPSEVFRTHDEAEMFRREQSVEFKEGQMNVLQAIYAPPFRQPRLITLRLSQGWLETIRSKGR